MIDEDVLFGLLGELAEGVAPPPDGPSRILARRDELAVGTPAAGGPTPTTRVRRYRILTVAAALLVLAAGSGVALSVSRHHPSHIAVGALSIGPAPTTARSAAASSPSDQFNPVGAAVPQSGGSGGGSAGGAASSGGVGSAGSSTGSAPSLAAPGPPAAPPATVPSVTTKVIKTGQVDLTVPRGDLAASITALTSSTAGLGGYIASTTTSDGGPTPTGAMTLRVPADQFETLLTRVQALGKATSVTTSGQDVTSQYVDLQARITALQQSRSRYLEILTQASSIGDILAVQQQIDGIQSQLEQLQGQLNVLNDQTSYATLTVQLTEPPAKPAPAPVHHHPSGISTAWAHARRSFARGAEAIIGASGGFAVFAVSLALLAAAARIIWGLVRRRLV